MTTVRIASAVVKLSAFVLSVSLGPTVFGQSLESALQGASLLLPDAPSAIAIKSADQTSSTTFDPAVNPNPKPTASVHRIRINEWEVAPQLTTSQQVSLALESSVSPLSMIGWVTAAGWSHAFNGIPNYGTNSEAFGKRLGASAAKGVSASIFSNAVMAPLLHEDFRYYRIGKSSGQGYAKRGLGAVKRVFVTRNNSGQPTPNLSQLIGNLGAAALTTTYYPERNRSAGQVGLAYGTALGGATVGNLVNEFLPDALTLTRLRKP